MKKLPFVSIIVPNYNGMKYTSKCLAYLKRINYPKNKHEIIVVDNASNDDSVKQLKKIKGIKLVVIPPPNIGFTGANNTGVRYAKGAVIALLSNDTEVDKNWLVEAVKVLSNKRIAIVGSHIRNIGEYYNYSENYASLLTILGVPIDSPDKDKTFGFQPGGCSLVYDKKIITQPFDQDYFMYSEDAYMAWFARLRGYDVTIAPKSSLDHIGAVTVRRTPKLLEFHAEKNRIMNLLLFYSFPTLAKISPLLLMNIIINLGIALFRGRIVTRTKSYIWLLIHAPRIMKKRMAIQKYRKISDKEILKYMSCEITYPAIIGKALTTFSRFYCWFFRMPVYELSRK
jgi:GT2 family glycosyltransferase